MIFKKKLEKKTYDKRINVQCFDAAFVPESRSLDLKIYIQENLKRSG